MTRVNPWEDWDAVEALARGEAVPGADGACVGCGHAKVWHSPRNRIRPCERCDCTSYRTALMNRLKISVVIATIPPREELLARALRSANAQLRVHDQLIVQLDEQGEGAGPTRNKAIESAVGDYIAVLDDDDEILPNHLLLLEQAAEATGADVVYSWFRLIDPDGNEIDDNELATMRDGELVHPFGVPFGPEQAAHMRRYAYIPACLMFRRQLALDVGGYPAPGEPDDVERNGCEDWALLIRLLDAGAKFVHVPARTWLLHQGSGTAGRPWREPQRHGAG